MKLLLLAFAIVTVPQLSAAGSTSNTHTFRVVASVIDVRMGNRGGPEMMAFVVFMIHSPAQFEGVQLIVDTESTKRASVHTEFPAGRLESIELPDSMLKKLSDYRIALETIEARRDQDTAAFSNSLTMPSIQMADLPEHPKPLAISP